MNDVNLKLIIATARVYNLIFSKIEKNVQGFGLNPSEFGVLEMLLHKGEQPVQKIADKILVTSGTITYVIDKLMKKDLVYRKNCEKDKRIFYVCLTEKGEAFISDIFPKHKEFIDDLFRGLDDNLKSEIVTNLFKLSDSLKGSCKGGVAMGKFEGAKKIGLRNKETDKLIAVYPNKVEGTDIEISKVVKDWYYIQDCSAEEELRTAYVDVLTEEEIISRK